MGDTLGRVTDSIRILEKTPLRPVSLDEMGDGLSGYLSIGSGEIRITVLDEEGLDILGWIAVIGWSALIKGDQDLKQSEAPVLTDDAGVDLHRMLDTVLGRTLDKHLAVKRIIIAAPYWMHDLIQNNVMSLRDKVSPILMETIV